MLKQRKYNYEVPNEQTGGHDFKSNDFSYQKSKSWFWILDYQNFFY